MPISAWRSIAWPPCYRSFRKMRAADITVLCLSAALLCGVNEVAGQDRPAPGPDPRVGLKAGLRDAETAARNMELVSHLPKPEGFFDPKAPAGTPTPPE